MAKKKKQTDQFYDELNKAWDEITELESKSLIISMSITPSERDQLNAISKELGMSRSAFIRAIFNVYLEARSQTMDKKIMKAYSEDEARLWKRSNAK